ncbi:unknown [Mycoplasma sp. CAG:956]|nr:unknown [Mycoplasma sp. CAG:956]
MNERLPKVFVNKIDKTLNVNQEATISSRKNSSLNWNKILDDKDKYLFNHQYLITLNNNETIEDSIISKQQNKILTLNGKKIDISDIKSVVEIKK